MKFYVDHCKMKAQMQRCDKPERFHYLNNILQRQSRLDYAHFNQQNFILKNYPCTKLKTYNKVCTANPNINLEDTSKSYV